MEDILTERFQFARITPFKDYCRLDEKKRLLNSQNEELDFLDGDNFAKWEGGKFNIMETPKRIGSLVSLPEKKKKKVFFASTTETVQEKFQLDYYVKSKYSDDNSFETTRDRHIRSHYGRPLSDITVTTFERSIRRHGDKITIKLYRQDKHRSYNCIYFRKSYSVQSVTFNMVTGNFTTLNKQDGRKIKRQSFRTNSFQSLLNISLGSSFFNLKKHFSERSRIYDEFQRALNDELFTTKIKESLGIENSTSSYFKNEEAFVNDIMNVFVKKKKIKVPNGNYDYLLTKLYPTEKFFKKNDRKLVASVLDMLGIKSKTTIKILHEHPNIDMYGLTRFIYYFGGNYSKYIGNIIPKTFEKSTRKSSIGSYNDPTTKTHLLQSKGIEYNLMDIEKENLIRIVNSFNYMDSNSVLSERFIQLMDDHIRMIGRVREFDPTFYLKSKTMQEFHVEHRELSKIISAIKKGWVIEYQYDEKVLEDLEKPLDCLYDDNRLHKLHPYVLKREEDYVEEGSFMHHCVASYADKDKSIIVSLRTEDGMDRVTCEFDIQSGRCLQERSFCNAKPPSHFEDGLLLLSEKINLYSRWGTLNWKEKKKVPIKINGIEITSELPTVRVTDIFDDVQLPFQQF
jgi:hypothetical protein